MSRPNQGAREAKRRVYLARTARILDCLPGEAEALLSTARRQSVRLNPLRADPAPTFDRLIELGVELEPVRWSALCYHLSSRSPSQASGAKSPTASGAEPPTHGLRPRSPIAVGPQPHRRRSRAIDNELSMSGGKRLVAGSSLFEQGAVYLQNASSFVPSLALDPRPGQAILDVAAAPGGKASHIAALTLNDADLWLNDPIPARARKLEALMDRYGVQYSCITEHPGQYVDKFIDASFDRVLLDAQCSGEGMLDLSYQDALRYWSVARIEKYRRLQQRMLVSAFKLLRPSGILVYSTCTFGPEENEHPVDHLLRHHPAADVLPIDLEIPGRRPGMRSWQDHRFDRRLAEAVRITPSDFFEGFFVCKLTKNAT